MPIKKSSAKTSPSNTYLGKRRKNKPATTDNYSLFKSLKKDERTKNTEFFNNDSPDTDTIISTLFQTISQPSMPPKNHAITQTTTKDTKATVIENKKHTSQPPHLSIENYKPEADKTIEKPLTLTEEKTRENPMLIILDDLKSNAKASNPLLALSKIDKDAMESMIKNKERLEKIELPTHKGSKTNKNSDPDFFKKMEEDSQDSQELFQTMLLNITDNKSKEPIEDANNGNNHNNKVFKGKRKLVNDKPSSLVKESEHPDNDKNMKKLLPDYKDPIYNKADATMEFIDKSGKKHVERINHQYAENWKIKIGQEKINSFEINTTA